MLRDKSPTDLAARTENANDSHEVYVSRECAVIRHFPVKMKIKFFKHMCGFFLQAGLHNLILPPQKKAT